VTGPPVHCGSGPLVGSRIAPRGVAVAGRTGLQLLEFVLNSRSGARVLLIGWVLRDADLGGTRMLERMPRLPTSTKRINARF
jgi:hypothetical protein